MKVSRKESLYIYFNCVYLKGWFFFAFMQIGEDWCLNAVKVIWSAWDGFDFIWKVVKIFFLNVRKKENDVTKDQEKNIREREK